MGSLEESLPVREEPECVEYAVYLHVMDTSRAVSDGRVEWRRFRIRSREQNESEVDEDSILFGSTESIPSASESNSSGRSGAFVGLPWPHSRPKQPTTPKRTTAGWRELVDFPFHSFLSPRLNRHYFPSLSSFTNYHFIQIIIIMRVNS